MTAPETVVRYYNFDIVFAEIPGETTRGVIAPTCRPMRGMCSTPRNCAPCWSDTDGR